MGAHWTVAAAAAAAAGGTTGATAINDWQIGWRAVSRPPPPVSGGGEGVIAAVTGPIAAGEGSE